MPNSKNIEMTEEQVQTATTQVERAFTLLQMEFQSAGIPEGMVMVAMARYMGWRINEATKFLGEERREEQLLNFMEIIRLHAEDNGESDETKKEE